MPTDRTTDSLLELQRTYYDLRAPDYMDRSRPADRKARGDITGAVAGPLIDEFAPTGDVLEIACGAGFCTKMIMRHANSLTALDGSAKMIGRNRGTNADARVRFVVADIFTWEPDRTYDSVVFSFWLSHVPPDERFDAYWRRVESCLKPGGRVCFIDEDDRGVVLEEHVGEVDGVPIARRMLADGRSFDIVKVFWEPAALTDRLRELGWSISIRRVGEMFLFGTGFRPRR